MPFQCCMGNKSQDKTKENKEECITIKKIPKPIDLNDGYNSQLELLVFNHKQNNKTYHGFNSMNRNINKLSYHPIHYCSTNPVTLVEAKVSNLVNTPNGPAISEASSNIILSGCNSPIKLVTSLETPPATNIFGYIEPQTLEANEKIYKCGKNSSTIEKIVSETNCLNEEKNNEVNEINNFLDCYNNDKEIVSESNDCLKTAQIIQKSQDIKSYLASSEDEFEHENDKIHKYTNSNTNLYDNIKSDEVTNSKNEEICNISGIKNDIDELISFSNLKNENKYVEKKKKKSKKTIHIEISFSPKNNIFVDAQHNQNEISKNKFQPLNKIRLESTYLNRQHTSHSEILTEKDTDKNIHSDSNRFTDEFSEAIHKSGVFNETVNNKFNESYESDLKRTIREDEATKEDISNVPINNILSNHNIGDTKESIKNIVDIHNDNDFEEKVNTDVHSFEKLIPFIDESEVEINNLNINNCENLKHSQQKESFYSLTDFKKSNSDIIELSQEALEKLNGSLPIVETDPQMAQLFASAQVRIEDINNQNMSFDNSKYSGECDPFDLIIKFLDCPSEYKNSISWATIKAVKEVYEPQVEYAKKELDRWMNGVNISDESKDNIDYYNSLIYELQEKLTLAEKARELFIAECKCDEIQLMLQNEKKSMEEIKERISQESNVLKSLEEQYLNGCITLKEDVRASRIKIKDLEDELKSKLAETHKLDDLLRIHEKKAF